MELVWTSTRAQGGFLKLLCGNLAQSIVDMVEIQVRLLIFGITRSELSAILFS
jgi:hypothetical protein